MIQVLTTLNPATVIRLLAKGRSAETLDQIINHYPYQLTPREIRIPEGAFNSSRAYTQAFSSCATVAFPPDFGQGVQALKVLDLNRKPAYRELQALSLAKIEGWSDRGYGHHVHKLVKREIYNAMSLSPKARHLFYVYNPDTVWYSDFEKQLEVDTLPDSFGGYSADLDAIFLTMWSNRQTMIQLDGDVGRKAVFHLLLPTYQAYTIKDTFAFDQSLAPLVVKGYRYGSQCLASFQFSVIPNNIVLQDVGNIFVSDNRRTQYRFHVLYRALCSAILLAVIAAVLAAASWALGAFLFVIACLLFPATMVYLYWEEHSGRVVRVIGPPTVREESRIEDLGY